MHNALHTYAIIKILLFEEKRASAAGNKSEIQVALSGTDHTETFGWCGTADENENKNIKDNRETGIENGGHRKTAEMESSKDLISVLWSGADILRSKMDANEYKDYLLGIVFYKYLSDSFLIKVYDLLYDEKPATLKEALEAYKEIMNMQI